MWFRINLNSLLFLLMANSELHTIISCWNTHVNAFKGTSLYRYFSVINRPCFPANVVYTDEALPFHGIMLLRSLRVGMDISKFYILYILYSVRYIEKQLRITSLVLYQQSSSTVLKYLLIVDFHTVIQISFSCNSPENEYFRQ